MANIREIQGRNMPAIFVYGTLKNRKRFQSITGIQFPDAIDAWTYGRMYQYEGYPVAFKDDEMKIHGLILDVPYEVLQSLDAFEEEGRLFIREKVMVNTEYGEEEAYIYWGNEKHPGIKNIPENYTLIEDGYWIEETEEIDWTLK